MITGCYTALITPFIDDTLDYTGLDKLLDFQIENGITGILAVGTTGESPTLSWEEHLKVVDMVAEKSENNCICIAGAGSNNTDEAIAATKHAAEAGADAVLLVDPYYNGPSSLEIRREYIEPVAEKFPDIKIIPYVIPGRTGAQLLPEDLAILCKKYPNVCTVKEATGNIKNMRLTRKCCGKEYMILSGDDAMILEMMTDPEISASGVISVVSNIVPGAVTQVVRLISEGKILEAENIIASIEPLFGLVTVNTYEDTPFGKVLCRARNPLGIKTLMALLGMPSGGCRRPLGKMTKKGLEKVVGAARKIHEKNPEILQPAADFFSVDISERINNPEHIMGLCYEDY